MYIMLWNSFDKNRILFENDEQVAVSVNDIQYRTIFEGQR